MKQNPKPLIEVLAEEDKMTNQTVPRSEPPPFEAVSSIKDDGRDPGPGLRETFWVAFQQNTRMRNYSITPKQVHFAKMNARMIEDRVRIAYNIGDEKIKKLLEPVMAKPKWSVYRNGSE